MWKLIWSSIVSLSIAVTACGFPRPRDVKPTDDGGEQPGDGGIDSRVDAKTCTQTTCTDGVLDVCGASGTVEHTERCALDCFSDESRCNELAPSNGLAPSLDQAGQHVAITLAAGSVVDTDSGAVTSAGTTIVVATVTVAQPGGPMLRVLLAQSWVLNDVRIRGTLPVAFVATGEIKVQGVIDASADAHTNGPGALICGSGSGGGGPGTGVFEHVRAGGDSGGYPTLLWASNGFGGGGFGTAGGPGGARELGGQVGTGGQPNGDPALVPLRGGCEGGDTSSQNPGATRGGAAGGACQDDSSAALRV
jgi:hypothetical protein